MRSENEEQVEEAGPDWGKYALEIAYSRAEAEPRYRYWQQRAAEIPGAEVKVLTLVEALGYESFIFCTETLELVPPRWRMSPEQIRQRLEELKRTSSPEDADAFAFLEAVLCPGSTHPESSEDVIARLEEEVDELRSRLRGIGDDLRHKSPPEE
jgi:hypothetical protein